MFLKNLVLFNFKSYEDHSFVFSKGINFLVGKNGSGKTNVLEAIYFACITKSFSGLKDQQLIKHEEQCFVINAKIDDLELVASIKEDQRKQILLNKKAYEKLSDHLGQFPVVFVSPNDHDYIRDSSEKRRSLFDELFCQVDRAYLTHLIEYNKLIKQRNQLLKQFKERNYFDLELLKTYDEYLSPHQAYISKYRMLSLELIIELVKKNYAIISNDAEEISIEYINDNCFDENSYLTTLTQNIEKDRALQRTSIGIHKDDYEFSIKELPIKKYGSQGQQKSFMLSLQLAKFDFIKLKKNLSPFLLLDDVFDKLDSGRIEKLLNLVSQENFKQVFITDASKERTIKFCTDFKIKHHLIDIQS